MFHSSGNEEGQDEDTSRFSVLWEQASWFIDDLTWEKGLGSSLGSPLF